MAGRAAAEQGRARLHARLQVRRPEIAQEALTRIDAISDPAEVADPAYLEGLRAAVAAALDYGLAGIERGEEQAPPPALLTQARLAARAGVSLDTVLRRYFAGYALFGDFLIEEADGDLLDGAELKRLLRSQASLFDRLLAAVSEEYAREENDRPDTSEQRRAERVQRLLGGELLDTSDLAYDLVAHHTGLIAVGPGAVQALRALVESLDCRLLYVQPDEEVAWAWLGGGRRIDPTGLESRASSDWPKRAVLAIGEPGHGLAGWRLTHRQAAAAVPVALRSPSRVVRYADVALLASIVQDDLLVTSLRQRYLDPLRAEREGGEVVRETLRAYFAAERNASAAAAAMGLSRRTVADRLRATEELLGCRLNGATAELEAALRLEELADTPRPARTT